MRFHVRKIVASEIFWLVLIMLLAVALRLIYLQNHPLETRDGIRYMAQTQQWFSDGTWQKQDPYLQSSPVLYCYLSKSLMHLGFSVERSTICVNFIAGIALLIPIWLAGKILFREEKADALLLTLFAAVCPKLIQYSCERLREGTFLFFSACVFCSCFYVIFCEKRTKLVTILCGTCTFLAVACRFEALELLFFCVCAICAVAGWREKKLLSSVQYASLFLAGLIIGFGIFAMLPGFPNIFTLYYTRLRCL